MIGITGSNGFLGKTIYNKLINSGYNVVKLIRNENQFILYDNLNLDTIIHCAAYLPKSYDNFSESQNCMFYNGTLTLDLLNEANKSNVKNFIYISSGQIYSWQQRIASENSPIDPIDRAAPYLISKVAGDSYIRSFKTNIRKVVLRPSLIYGIGMKQAGILHRLINLIKSNDIINIDNYYLDIINVNDLSNFIIKSCFDSNINGIYNIGCGDHLLTVHSLAIYIAAFLEKSITITGEMKNGHALLNIDRAENAGFLPTNLKLGLKEYLESLND